MKIFLALVLAFGMCFGEPSWAEVYPFTGQVIEVKNPPYSDTLIVPYMEPSNADPGINVASSVVITENSVESGNPTPPMQAAAGEPKAEKRLLQESEEVLMPLRRLRALV